MGSMEFEGRVYAPPLDSTPGYRLEERDGEGSRKLMIGVIMVGVVAAVGGVGWNIYANSGEPPVIAGDKGNFKTMAATQPGEGVEDREVYDVIEGGRPVGLTTVAAKPGPAKPEPIDLRPPPGAMAPAEAADAAPGLFKPDVSPQGAFMVQLAALRTETAARDAWGQLSARSPGLVRDARMDIQRADLGPQGIFYRLRAGYFVDRERAQAFCERAKGAGQDCMVVAR